MIARRFRFHGYNSLKRVYQHGQTARGSVISVRYASIAPGRNYRVAVVVSKKVHKSAVVRNRIRRRIYEQVRLAEKQPMGDLVFTVFNDQVADMETTQLRNLIVGLLEKASQAPQKAI